MKLTPEAIRDFQQAYLKDFGEAISAAEATELGTRLIGLMQVVYQPLPSIKPRNKSPPKKPP